jgi:hypothetical protein
MRLQETTVGISTPGYQPLSIELGETMKTVKINFNLEVDDGFPPIGVETLNAKALEDGTFELLNTPFFVKETAYGDIVSARMSAGSRLEFTGCVRPSTYKAIAVILLGSNVRQRLMDNFDWKDCIVEYGEFTCYKMLAIAIPGIADYAPIRAVLDLYEKDEQLSFAELVA